MGAGAAEGLRDEARKTHSYRTGTKTERRAGQKEPHEREAL